MIYLQEQCSNGNISVDVRFMKGMKAGEIFTGENVRSIRPGYDLGPKHFKDVIGAADKALILSKVYYLGGNLYSEAKCKSLKKVD